MTRASAGYRFAALAAVISGFSIYVNGFGLRVVPDSTLYTTLKNGVAGVALLVPVLLLARCRREVRGLSRRDLGWLVLLAVVGGSIPYVLFFRGLQLTTASTGSLLNHLQFVFVAAIAIPALRERLTGAAWAGLGLLAAGTLLGSDLGALRLNEGALLVLASTLLFAAGAVLTRRLLAGLSAEVVMAAKMSAGALLLVGYTGLTGHLARLPELTSGQWLFALGTGAILVGFTVATTHALQRAPALAVTAIGMVAPLITLALHLPAGGRVAISASTGAGLGLLVAGACVFLLARTSRTEPRPERGLVRA